jgi:peptide deformylase
MILPVYVYGSAILKKEAQAVTKEYPELKELIANMWDTLHNAEGVGLAAPQVGRGIRLLVIDASPFGEDDPAAANFKRLMINPEIIEFSAEQWSFNEGCLSIPEVRENVIRPKRILVRYLDEDFTEHEEWLDGIPARITQHEYDHVEGIVFTERLSPIRRKLIAGRLQNIARGKTGADYKTKIV